MASAFVDSAYKSKLPDLMKTHNFSYFEICDNKDKVMVYCPSGLSSDQASEFLRDSLDGFIEGEFSVNLFESAKKKSISQTYPFKLTSAVAAIGAVSNLPIQERLALEKKIWELETQQKIEGIVSVFNEKLQALEKPSGGIFGVLDNIQNLVDKYPMIGEVCGNLFRQWMDKQQPAPAAAINGVNDTDQDFINFINACGGMENAKMILQAATPHIKSKGMAFITDLYKFINSYGKGSV